RRGARSALERRPWAGGPQPQDGPRAAAGDVALVGRFALSGSGRVYWVSAREGWTVAGRGDAAGGKSGLRRAGCWVTPRGGNPTDQCHRKETAVPSVPERVAGREGGNGEGRAHQRCGGPRWLRQPHPEQSQKGEQWRGPRRSRVRPLETSGNRRPREMIVTPIGKPAGVQDPAYRPSLAF